MGNWTDNVGYQLKEWAEFVLDLAWPYTTHKYGLRSTAMEREEWTQPLGKYGHGGDFYYYSEADSPWRTRVRWHRLVLGAAVGMLCGLVPVGEFLAGEPGSRTLLDLIVVLIWPLLGAVIGVVASVVLPFVIVFGFCIGLLLGLIALPFWLFGLLLEFLGSIRF